MGYGEGALSPRRVSDPEYIQSRPTAVTAPVLHFLIRLLLSVTLWGYVEICLSLENPHFLKKFHSLI